MDWAPYDRVADIWNRLTVDWGRLSTFWDMTKVAGPFIRDAFERTSAASAYNFIHGSGQRFLLEGHALEVGTVAAGLAKQNIANYQHIASGALLVFAHALLDDIVLECVRLTAYMDVATWMDLVVGKKTASFASLRQQSVDELARAAIEKELDTTWSRASLMEKVEVLHRVVQPAQQVFLTDGFRFDSQRLERLTEARNRVVHRPDYRWDAPEPAEEVAFMRSAGTHLLMMAIVRYDLAISPDKVKESMTRRAQRRGN